MNELFHWPSTNPVATTAVIVLFCVVVVSLVVIYLIAFLQGREVSFWPPKIGTKSDEASKILPIAQPAKGKTESLDGIWLSLFEYGKMGNMNWINEEVHITYNNGLVKLRSIQNEKGYKWEGEGRIIDNNYVYGEIHSIRPGAHSHTLFILTIHRQGNCLYGKWITPNEKSKVITGSWVLGRQKSDLDNAKKFTSESELGKRR